MLWQIKIRIRIQANANFHMVRSNSLLEKERKKPVAVSVWHYDNNKKNRNKTCFGFMQFSQNIDNLLSLKSFQFIFFSFFVVVVLKCDINGAKKKQNKSTWRRHGYIQNKYCTYNTVQYHNREEEIKRFVKKKKKISVLYTVV